MSASWDDLGLYIHIPWCVQKCPYCDFNSHALKGALPEAEYVAALMRDLDFELRLQPQPRPITSIFFGGGTPSVFSGDAITAILDGVRARLLLAANAEITLEANPGTVEAGRFAAYRAAGVNRLSMGVQSLNNQHLKALGRIHDAGEATAALATARAAGFDNINLDLMFALPQQTEAEAEADLAALIALDPEHISYYHLTLEPNTAFYRQPPPLPDDDSAFAMLERGQAMLAAAGYGQYETSAYARSNRQSRHNLTYWRFADYLGIGAGAHGKYTGHDLHTGALAITRRARHKHPRTYMQSAGEPSSLQESRRLEADDLVSEFAMNTLRLHQGFTLAQWRATTGLEDAHILAPVQRAQKKGLLAVSGDTIAPTELGRAHLNPLLLEFLP